MGGGGVGGGDRLGKSCFHCWLRGKSGTSVLWTLSGSREVRVLIKEVSSFQKLFSTLLHVAGTTGSACPDHCREVSLIRMSSILIERFHCANPLVGRPGWKGP